MEIKDIGLIGGVAVTFLLGVGNLIYNVLLSRRTAFINTVTSERVKWIGNLRDNLSKFVGLTHHWFVLKEDIEEPKKDDMTRELRVLRYHIRLQLNPSPKATIDRDIMEMIEQIADSAPNFKIEELQQHLDNLVLKAQKLLKSEWDKVKREAQRGALADHPTFWEGAGRLIWGSEGDNPPHT